MKPSERIEQILYSNEAPPKSLVQAIVQYLDETHTAASAAAAPVRLDPDTVTIPREEYERLVAVEKRVREAPEHWMARNNRVCRARIGEEPEP